MKEFIRAVCVIGGCIFFIPLIIVYASGSQRGGFLAQINAQQEAQQKAAASASLIGEDKIVSILAKEIPYTYEYETLKAQAVIIRTYLARRALGIENKGELTGYTIDQMKELWGENYEDIYATYKEAAADTQNEMILYKGEPIEAVYHEASGGRTRSAKDVYNAEVPYLQSVISEGDTITKQISLSKSEIAAKLKEAYPDIIIDESILENQIQIIEKDEAEYIKSIQVGNVIIAGETFRKLLGLSSSNFTIYKQNDHLMFDVKGAGHGVGLSQNGANEMAKQGKNYKDIIKYYYKDVKVENYSDKK